MPSAAAPSREASLARGAALFDRGSFFEAHEAWEERWLVETDETTRRLFQGLIRIAAGFHKLVVVNDRESAGRLLAKGLAKLDGCAGAGGASIERFREEIRACARALALGRLDATAIPRLGL